jgi:hypothetical protein
MQSEPLAPHDRADHAPEPRHEDIAPAFFPRLTPLLAPDVMRWINHQLLRPPEPGPTHALFRRHLARER